METYLSRYSIQQQKRLSRLWQAAADGLTAGSPVEVKFGIIGHDTTVFKACVWTSALTRERMSYWWGIDAVKRATGTDYQDLTAEEAATSIVKGLIGPTIFIQQRRWVIAEALGLVRKGQPIDLPASEMMIDRSLLTMLDANHVDVRRAGTLVKFNDDVVPVGDGMPDFMIGVELNDHQIFVRQEKMMRPVICSWVSVGSAYYDGTSLALNGSLPGGIMAAAVGRTLGEVVSTGVSQLDERLITDISEIGEHGFTLRDTVMDLAIRLAPDLVKLGIPRG